MVLKRLLISIIFISLTVDVKEDASLGTPVVKMNAFDLDSDSQLVYKIIDRDCKAFDENGRLIDFGAVKQWFGINASNGQIFTKSKLDREFVEEFVLTISVQDINAHPEFSPQIKTSKTSSLIFYLIIITIVKYYLLSQIIY